MCALLATATLLASAVAGCASSGSTPASAPATAPATGTPTPCASGRSGDVRTVTDADSGATICLAVGARLEVYLHSTLSDMWSPISLGGNALAPQANGKGTLPIGVTGGFFVARTKGSAHLTSTRAACPAPSTATAACGRTQFALDVMVG
jgi:hypothetical protein